MYKYIIHFRCQCREESFIELFNYLNGLLNKGDAENCTSLSSMHTTYLLPDDIRRVNRISKWGKQVIASQIENFVPVSHPQHINLSQAIILVSVDIPWNDRALDIFSYRYLLLIIQLLREQDLAVISCDQEYYNRIGSYFILEALSSNQLFAYVTYPKKAPKLIPFPQVVTVSPEWFPAIRLGPDSIDVYDVLNNPLFESDAAVYQALTAHRNDREKNKINLPDELKARIKEIPTSPQNLYRIYFQCCFERWYNGIISDTPLAKQLRHVSGMAQLLFAAMCRNLYGSKNSSNIGVTTQKLEELLEACCDFSDCIMQVAENIVSHTNGGVLSIRINDKWDKISGAFAVESMRDSFDKYVRISLVDYSDRDILANIKEKAHIEGLSLNHIFGTEKDENYQKYQLFLDSEDHVIHHYGLSVFSNVVEQYRGCFAVRSGVTETFEESQWYTPDNSYIRYKKHVSTGKQIPGTEYDVLLVLDERNFQKAVLQGNPSLLVTPQYISEIPKQNLVYKEDLAGFFNKNLSNLIRSSSGRYSYQELKEHIVKNAAERLSEHLIANGPENSVFYFFLSNVAEQVFGRVEIIAKILLQSISLLKSKGHPHVYIVLYGLSENRIASFVRQYALFYHRESGNLLMEHCQIYIISENYQAEALFAGTQLRAISDYNQARRLVSGTSMCISNILEHIAQRQTTAQENVTPPITPIPFDLMNRMEITPDGLSVSPHHKWYYNNLLTVLNNDIHGNDLGCCINNVHVRTEKVHLHKFFEGQLLFANAYWYQIFAHFLCEQVNADPLIKRSQSSILLYGYETYSEQMLFAAKKKLIEKGYDVSYALYENPKYITAEQISDRRIRYLENFLEKNLDKDICIIFIFGIGTTLATLEHRMYADLLEFAKSSEVYAKLAQAYKKGIVIIQVDNSETQQKYPDQITCNQTEHTVQSKNGYLDFLTDKQCIYLARVEAEWAPAENCTYCFPNCYLDELPLIQTNETSTIPMLLIKPDSKDKEKICYTQQNTFSDSFLNNPENAQYLYYAHLDRSGNHHQFYLRTASLLHDYLEKPNSEIHKWFEQIKKLELTDTVEHPTASQISIIVSPRHFSNESFVAAVNQYVFDGKAYIIDFDVKKEFRESFAAKFRNYRTALGMMKLGLKVEFNFYYVDDCIITGTTFNRAKSLVSSMLGSFYSESNNEVSVNLFKAIIVLVNRNSKNTLRNYFAQGIPRDSMGNITLPVYRFIELNTPSIRSYGDSCPLCSQVETINNLRKESSLSFVEKYWCNKANQHKLMKLSSAKQHKQASDNQHHRDPVYISRGFRRLQCSEFIWGLLKTEHINEENAKELLEARINQNLTAIDNELMRVEYLISFLKIISRAHIVYQENINTAILQILLSIFSVFVDDKCINIVGLYKTVHKLVYSSSLLEQNPDVLYELYQIVIARLCSMGSVLLCRAPQLDACLDIGFQLESLCRSHHMKALNTGNQSMLTSHINCFSDFLTVQMKKMLFATKDCDLRVTQLAAELKGHIKNVIEEGFDESPKA